MAKNVDTKLKTSKKVAPFLKGGGKAPIGNTKVSKQASGVSETKAGGATGKFASGGGKGGIGRQKVKAQKSGTTNK